MQILKVVLNNHHRAVDDAECTAEIFKKLIHICEEKEVYTLEQVNEMGKASTDAVSKLPYYHIILLARNDVGRVNLYTMVSESHLTYYNRRPKIPKSMLEKHIIQMRILNDY